MIHSSCGLYIGCLQGEWFFTALALLFRQYYPTTSKRSSRNLRAKILLACHGFLWKVLKMEAFFLVCVCLYYIDDERSRDITKPGTTTLSHQTETLEFQHLNIIFTVFFFNPRSSFPSFFPATTTVSHTLENLKATSLPPVVFPGKKKHTPPKTNMSPRKGLL